MCLQTPTHGSEPSKSTCFSSRPSLTNLNLLDASSHFEVMDMSAGDLVSVGCPSVCAWDGTSSLPEHNPIPCFPKSSMEQRFAADLNADSTAQRAQGPAADGTCHSSAERLNRAEQGSQTGFEAPREQSRQTRRLSNSNCSLLGMHSLDHSRCLATLDGLAGLLLPQNCRVAARVSTKLPPLDHNPMLPPLPEGFVLPPEMHPVVGTYTSTNPKTATTGSQTAAAWQAASPQATTATADAAALAGHIGSAGRMQGAKEGAARWLHLREGPPAPEFG